MNASIFPFLGLGLGTFLVTLGVLALLGASESRSTRRNRIALDETKDDIVFLFDDVDMVNASPQAQALLSAAPDEGGSDWARLLSLLLPRFPDLSRAMRDLADLGRVELSAHTGAALLKAEWHRGLARVTLVDHDATQENALIDRYTLDAMERELETLRETAEHAPFLVWRELADGTITWANAAYLALVDDISAGNDHTTWPPKRLFNRDTLLRMRPNANPFVAVETPSGPRWFDLHRATLGHDTLYTAVVADRTVKAEAARREVVQTLTKTFSHLTFGLIVFDKDRKVMLFNPAFGDLTTLSPEFLLTGPTLGAVLDMLRDKKMMPEPKDYTSWRHQISELETAAVEGRYEETWSLAGGKIYRVTGRPHADGAIGFLFQDISAEMALTRNFRAEIETGQAVLDTLDEAIAVFSSDGILTMSNTAYASLWGTDRMDSLAQTDARDATRLWHSKSAPSGLWNDIRDFIHQPGERESWTASTRLWDGRALSCRITALPRGATLVGFSPMASSLTQDQNTSPQAGPRFVAF
ncbi:PAS-domain containing protein [Aquimixticola soesokkakensis]|nr:PAS-domain containing protein [Aquimixticola soesokkakensis]